uniref:N-acetyltransferase domain-containing protein n=1 Tax=Chromera velia CCMP2878 TaxID=1169474 RepID=A0A0G4I147_9ALVE|eukprot:Cvel_26.t1-p1 / transcript=Cvel_26.t1 / gene=Cvel_26 / organism=Chromera_velia_CCMP2878 / gene_product=hypothetical protein / transcript_product=hypothetical protein / location=Cvel_scaffold5:160837-161802(-) / protein_length=322 / sequence_SO=supercontig / SO=protein_coding / is_pseudo=false
MLPHLLGLLCLVVPAVCLDRKLSQRLDVESLGCSTESFSPILLQAKDCTRHVFSQSLRDYATQKWGAELAVFSETAGGVAPRKEDLLSFAALILKGQAQSGTPGTLEEIAERLASSYVLIGVYKDQTPMGVATLKGRQTILQDLTISEFGSLFCELEGGGCGSWLFKACLEVSTRLRIGLLHATTIVSNYPSFSTTLRHYKPITETSSQTYRVARFFKEQWPGDVGRVVDHAADHRTAIWVAVTVLPVGDHPRAYSSAEIAAVDDYLNESVSKYPGVLVWPLRKEISADDLEDQIDGDLSVAESLKAKVKKNLKQWLIEFAK